MLSRTSYKSTWYQTWKKENPWLISFYAAKSRCINPKNLHFKYYGGRGIKFLLTKEEIKELWFRDKAYDMQKPSIDRKDVTRNYTVENCQFIELQFNSMKDKKLTPVGQYTEYGLLVKIWPSINSVSSVGFDIGNVFAAIKYGWKCGGYSWRKVNAQIS